MITAERIRSYSIIILSINVVMLTLTFVRPSLFPTPFGGDFAVFYSAGRIVNERGDLYDLELQDRLAHEAVAVDKDLSAPYVNPPFFAAMFAPFARAPFVRAYAAWLIVSVLLYGASVLLALRVNTNLPPGLTLLAAFAFPPFCMYALGGGQVSAFGCFFLSLAIFLSDRGRSWLAGLALSLLLYKPPLLIILIPALLFARKYRELAEFALGASALVAICWLMVGTDGLIDYVNLLRRFGGTIGFEGTRAAKYVDLGAFVRLLFHFNLGVFPALLGIASSYFMRKSPWLAILPTFVLNTYSPIYDLAILVPVVIAFGLVRKELAYLFLGSLFALPLALLAHVQIITPILALLSIKIGPVQPKAGAFRYGTTATDTSLGAA